MRPCESTLRCHLKKVQGCTPSEAFRRFLLTASEIDLVQELLKREREPSAAG